MIDLEFQDFVVVKILAFGIESGLTCEISSGKQDSFLNLFCVVQEGDSADDFLETYLKVKCCLDVRQSDVLFEFKRYFLVIKDVLDFVDKIFWACTTDNFVVNDDFGNEFDKVTD